MPTCPTCHVAAISAAQSASAVRDIGIIGALSIAAMPVLAIRHKRAIADVPAVLHRHQTYGIRRAVVNL